MKKKFVYSLIAILGLSFLSEVSAKNKEHVTQEFENGSIDWTDKIIKVTGGGAIPSNKPIGQGRLLAERAAISDAYRQMTEIVYGVRVNSETTIRDFVVESDIIKTKVDGFIKGAKKGEKRINQDGAIEYDLYVPLYGQNALSDVIDLDLEIKKHQKLSMKESHNTLFKYSNKYAFKFNQTNDFFKIASSPDSKDNNENNSCLECHKPHPIRIKSETTISIKHYNKPTQNVNSTFEKDKKQIFNENFDKQKENNNENSNDKIDNKIIKIYENNKISNEDVNELKPNKNLQQDNKTISKTEENIKNFNNDKSKISNLIIDSQEINQNSINNIPEQNITGVIIDARGLGLVPAMDPAILDPNMKRVYIGNWEIDPDFVINNGIIGYFTDIEDAKKDLSRIGTNPIVLKANSVKNLTNLVLELEIANKLINTDNTNNFLQKYAVNVVM